MKLTACHLKMHNFVRCADLGAIEKPHTWIRSKCGTHVVCSNCGFFTEYTGSIGQLLQLDMAFEVHLG